MDNDTVKLKATYSTGIISHGFDKRMQNTKQVKILYSRGQ